MVYTFITLKGSEGQELHIRHDRIEMIGDETTLDSLTLLSGRHIELEEGTGTEAANVSFLQSPAKQQV